jgi:hypothetical protein
MICSQNDVTLTLKKEEALVLFELLANIKEEAAIPIRDGAERRAIWNLAVLFESKLAEPFMHDYAAIIQDAKSRPVAGHPN